MHSWTGFKSPYSNPIEKWESLLAGVDSKISEYHDINDVHTNDEEWNKYKRFSGESIGVLYYHLGKHCLTPDEYSHLSNTLPDRGYTSRKSFTTALRRLEQGWEDAQGFRKEGAGASTVDDLKMRINEIISSRKTTIAESNDYYQRLMTIGYLDAHLFQGDLGEIFKAANWRSSP